MKQVIKKEGKIKFSEKYMFFICKIEYFLSDYKMKF